jgi:hypothetical protein
VTRIQAVVPRNCGSLHDKVVFFSPLASVQVSSGFHETSYSVGTRSCFSQGKSANVDHSTPSNTYLVIYLLNYLRMYLLTQWSRVLLEKLTCSQLVKQFPAFYGTRNSSLLPLQEPTICPCSKLDKSSTFLPSHFLKIHFDITSFVREVLRLI